jgi:hypothetical protein
LTLRPALAATLEHLHGLSSKAGVSPILFGTAVLELLGIGSFEATDLDVIATVPEARALAAAAGIEPDEASGNDRFSSEVHLNLEGAPLVIDVMAEMRVHTAEGWEFYEVGETSELSVAGQTFRAISLADLLRFYRLADRDKDEAKIAALAAAVSFSI